MRGGCAPSRYALPFGGGILQRWRYNTGLKQRLLRLSDFVVNGLAMTGNYFLRITRQGPASPFSIRSGRQISS
jgi:hypothetical protein